MAKKTVQRSAPGDKRRQAMMDAAWKLFMQKGYGAVSLDEIIRKSGGSKSSIYEFFGNKEGLFSAIIEGLTAKILADMRLPDTEGIPVRDALRRIGLALGRDILSEHGVGQYRLSVSISKTFPKMAKLFYESGPRTAQRALADYLAKEARTGRLKIKDPLRASEIFHALLLDFTHMAMSLNVRSSPTDKELKQLVDEAVDLFLKIYGV
ncbi:MAG: TetR/AcrR family transcriptional regulator [Betaproteobacteria bacterium]